MFANRYKQSSLIDRLLRQRSTSLEQLCESDDDTSSYGTSNPMTGSMELLPSENSAFSHNIPPRLPHLPHTQSEPILSLDKVMRHQQCSKIHCRGGKLVQVKTKMSIIMVSVRLLQFMRTYPMLYLLSLN